MTPRRDITPRETAAEWLERQEAGALTPDEQARLDAWLAEDGAAEAYAAMARVHALTDAHAAAPPIMALRQAALTARRADRRPIWGVAAAATIAVAVIGSGLAGLTGMPSATPSPITRAMEALSASANPKSAVHRTRVGERLTFTLPDGSVATLNTDSILKVDYHQGERAVRLVRGQALFEVAKNKAVPFRVYAADRAITAVGTVFDVRLDGASVKVALVEGVVRVAPAKAAPSAPGKPVQQVQMSAGEVLEAPPAQPMRVASADVQRAVSWRSGLVEFSGETLGAAVAEMNRYTTRPIEIADPAAGAYRVSGVFRTGEPELFARMMTEVFPLEADTASGQSIVLKRKY
ncbi:MAG TPA: FecR domain-containing protein [Caulobacteraceae bacterium]